MKRSAFERWRHVEGRAGEVVILDNRDSFVFNLVHRIARVSRCEIVVVRSDEVSAEEIESWAPGALIISPGPGHPGEAGCSIEAIVRMSARVPILGVCLGHQAIVEAYGGEVRSNQRPMHGEASRIVHDGRGVFEGCDPRGEEVGRYHALSAVRESLPEVLEVSASLAESEEGMVMGVRHRSLRVHGVQFHPESVLSRRGEVMVRNFMRLAGYPVL